MNKEDFISHCGNLGTLAGKIINAVDSKEFRSVSGVVKPKSPEYRLYFGSKKQFCQIKAKKQKNRLLIELKRPCPLESLSTVNDEDILKSAMCDYNLFFETKMETKILKHDYTKPSKRIWQRFFVQEHDAEEIIQFIKVCSMDWGHAKSKDVYSNLSTRNLTSYYPSKEDCETAIKQLFHQNRKASTKAVLDQISSNLSTSDALLAPDWREITSENMKLWSDQY